VCAKAGEAFRRKLASPEFRARWEANQQAARNRRRSASANTARGPDEALPNTGSNVDESDRASQSPGPGQSEWRPRTARAPGPE
jgi:hypothetical protein